MATVRIKRTAAVTNCLGMVFAPVAGSLTACTTVSRDDEEKPTSQKGDMGQPLLVMKFEKADRARV
jgi:hypothetical protein